jgi:hypothetical protein
MYATPDELSPVPTDDYLFAGEIFKIPPGF